MNGVTLDFTWQSTAWVKNYESPTQFTITGPFTLSGQGSVTFAELVTGGPGARHGLGVLTPTAMDSHWSCIAPRPVPTRAPRSSVSRAR
jgi:hypothetical protein